MTLRRWQPFGWANVTLAFAVAANLLVLALVFCTPPPAATPVPPADAAEDDSAAFTTPGAVSFYDTHPREEQQ